MHTGLFGSLLISLIGVRLFFDGLRGERPDRLRSLGLPAWLLVAGGFLCQLPLAINLYALWLQSGN